MKARDVSKTTIVVAVVALSLFGAAVALAVLIVGAGAESTPVLVTVVGFLAPTIVALLALLRQDRSRAQLEQIDRKVDAVHERADELADVPGNDMQHARRPDDTGKP